MDAGNGGISTGPAVAIPEQAATIFSPPMAAPRSAKTAPGNGKMAASPIQQSPQEPSGLLFINLVDEMGSMQ